MALPAALIQTLRDAASEIAAAARPIKVLRAIAWPADVASRFFAAGARELPRPEYAVAPELDRSIERLRALKARVVGDNEIERYLRETCASLVTAARMMQAVGTRDFYHHAIELYGRPSSLSADRRTTNLDLARHFDQVIAGLRAPATDEEDEPRLAAGEAATLLRARLDGFFGPGVVGVEVATGLAAHASAGADEVRINAGTRFSPRDVALLLHHEGQVHVATSQNGRRQPVLTFLGSPMSRVSRTQEGLAVLTELLTRSISLERLRRLADRTIGIQMAEDGADFLALYRFFQGRGQGDEAAFDSARRICRGGLVEGGAPFTKDVCYLDGLLRVTNFLRVALTEGHAEYVGLLFAGKVDVDDVPLLGRLLREGLVAQPVFLPDWARDISYLTAFMGWAAFLGETDLAEERRRFADRVARAEGDWGPA